MSGKAFNARILVKLLRNRPHAFGAEIGVFEGDTSYRLLEALPDLKTLICVDQWKHDQEFLDAMANKCGRIFNANWEKVEAVFLANVVIPYGERVLVIKNRSTDAAATVKNESLDFVFIDGDHTYKHVKADINAWWPKLRIGGLLTGDDYKNKPGYGVIKAVNEIFGMKAANSGRIWYTPKETREL